jgi:hypothetical protein
MLEQILYNVPEHWQDLVELLAAPLSWIPQMQQHVMEFLFGSSGGVVFLRSVVLLFPALLWLTAVWCTQLSLYTLPFRSGRMRFVSTMLMAWWDAARMTWLYWVGLTRLVWVGLGWLFTIGRFGIKLFAEAARQLVMMPFTMTGKMTATYFQPGVPWIAFLMLVFWCLLEATIFSYTLYPTVSEVVADLTGRDQPSAATFPILFFFLFLLIMGSFACVQTLVDAVTRREFKFLTQMILIELFVMFFEVMFLYRELVDAITPWIAQQTGVRMGIGFTLTLATFGWLGVRGMNWFLFGQFGTPPMLAFISRQPLEHPETAAAVQLAHDEPSWWVPAIQDFKREIGWLHEKSDELLEYLALPVLHVLAAALNFAMILVASRPAFGLPFKGLQDVMETKEMLAELRSQPIMRPRTAKGAEA